MAMYKTGKSRNGQRNAGNAGNRGNVIFRGMFSNIPGNVAKHPGECCQIFRGMTPNILGNVAKHSGECLILLLIYIKTKFLY